MDRRFISFVLAKGAPRPAADAVLIGFNAALRPLGLDATMVPGQGADGPLVFTVAGKPITALFIDKPVPASELEEAMALERQWPSVRQDVAAHTSHVIVAPLDEPQNNSEAASLAIFTTFLSATLVEQMRAIGVYWVSGRKLSNAAIFTSQAIGIAQKRIPVLSWLQLTFLNGPDATPSKPTIAVVTTGMMPFIGRELEWQPDPTPPDVAAQRVLNIAAYLIANGLVIHDGQTMEVAPGEVVRATYSDRGHKPGTAALQLQVERSGPEASGPTSRKTFGRRGTV